jgi:hypothetical protein
MSSEAAYFPNALARTADRQTPVGVNEGQLPIEIAEVPSKAAGLLSDVPDEELLEQLSPGGREARGVLFKRYARSVRSVAQRTDLEQSLLGAHINDAAHERKADSTLIRSIRLSSIEPKLGLKQSIELRFLAQLRSRSGQFVTTISFVGPVAATTLPLISWVQI